MTPLTNVVACPGGIARFSTVAGGPLPYKFEWWRNGIVIPGQTNNSLTLSNVTQTQAGTYSVKLTGGYSSVTNSATLTIRTNVAVAPLPDLIRSIGANAVFTPAVTGTGPFAYQWYKNGAAIPAATASTLTLTNLTIANSGNYCVAVSGTCSSATNCGSLTVDSCFPAVDVMLVMDRSGSMTGKPYNDVRLACTNFVRNLHFGTDGDKAGLASYNSTATLDQTLTNNEAVLELGINKIPAPTGNTSISLGLLTGQTELLSVRHNAKALPVLVLLSDGQPTGTDTRSNDLYQATLAKNAGTRIFAVGLGTNIDSALLAGIASSPADYFYTTNSAQVTALFNAISSVICRPPTNIVVIGPSNQTVCAGSPVIFSATASNCMAFTYQWTHDGARLAGATNPSLIIPSAMPSDAGIYAIEVGSVCSSVTNRATLTVNSGVTLTNSLHNLTNCPGTSAIFSVGATGTGLTYRWFHGATLLINQTGPAATLTNVSSADAGSYSVVINGLCGNPVTNSAMLTVTALPTISVAGNKSIELGAPWQFDIPVANYPFTIFGTVTNTSAHCGNTFDATRTWIALDYCGNSATCTQTVNVVDNMPPILTCSTNHIVQIGDSWTFDPPTFTDNGRTNVTVTVLGTVTNFVGHCGNTFDATRTWQAMDACSNVASCSQTITVIDTIPPILTCSTNRIVQIGDAWTFDPPTFTDNGGTNVTITVLGTVTNYIGHCGNTFDATRTWQAMDACSNVASCSQTIALMDTTAPILTCSTNRIVQIGDAWDFDPPTFTDNGGTNVTITVLGTVTNFVGHCGNTFDATRTWQATDACSNVASCSQTIALIDTTAPILTCSTNRIIQIGDAWTFDPPTFTDNGGTNVTITVLGTVTNYIGHCGNTFDATRTWQAIDACSNVASCSQTITLIDTIPPVIICSSNKVVQLGTAWTFDPPTVTDNGGTNVIITVIGTVTNFLGHCGDGFDATRTWLATDGCNNTAQCSQTVTVNDSNPIIIPFMTGNQTVCARTDVSFQVNPARTNLTFAWTRNGQLLSALTNFVLTNVDASAAGVYTLVVSDACGDSITNSVSLTVNAQTAAAPLVNAVRNLGESVTFPAVPSGTGPFTFTWRKNGSVLAFTGSSLTLTNLGYSDAGTYSVDIAGTCNTITRSAVLVINHPPTVSIVSPTNGAVFIAPANFTVLAEPSDIDGTITNVAFWLASTNSLGQATNSPYFVVQTNVAAGTYSFKAVAFDDLGARGTSSVVTVSVIDRPPLSVVTAMHYDPQTDFFIQRVRVTNPTYSTYDAVRIYISGLSNNTVVYNASGYSNGTAYVESHQAILPGTSVDFTIEYFTPLRLTPYPVLRAELIPPSNAGADNFFGLPRHIQRSVMLPDKTFLVEFLSATNRVYRIQYSTNLVQWLTVTPALKGSGTFMQWIDNGQPKTISSPAATPVRFYRVLLLP